MAGDAAKTGDEKTPGGKPERAGFLAPAIIVAFLLLTLAGTYFVRRHLLETAMINAMKLGDKEAMWDLARSFPCPVGVRDSGRGTLLHRAVQWQDRAFIELLLRKGVDVNAGDKYGWTPLHRAANRAGNGIAELLIANGADVNAQDDFGATPLHFAASKPVAEALITKGADVHARTRGALPLFPVLIDPGATPLHVAAVYGRTEVAALLIAMGADVNAKDDKGKTPRRLANENGQSAVAEVLRKAGAKE